MSGVDKNTQICYSDGTDHHLTTIGTFIDGIYTTNSVPNDTVSVDVSSAGYTILAMNQSGNTSDLTILTVKRMPISFESVILQISDLMGNTLVCGSGTPVCTRVNNVVDALTADQYDVGDYFCCGLTTFSNTPFGVQTIQLPYNMTWDVPNVITGTWGEFDCTRTDAGNFIQVCEDYPDLVDPNDINVFNEILAETAVYAPITDVTDVSSGYTGTHLYWIETNDTTEFSAFQIQPTSLEVGYPQPVPSASKNKVKSSFEKIADKVRQKSSNILEAIKRVT
jgi:hypothetical protein